MLARGAAPGSVNEIHRDQRLVAAGPGSPWPPTSPVVRAGAAGDRDRGVVGSLRNESLQAEVTPREPHLDRAQRLLADNRAHAAVDAGVIALDLVAEAQPAARRGGDAGIDGGGWDWLTPSNGTPKPERGSASPKPKSVRPEDVRVVLDRSGKGSEGAFSARDRPRPSSSSAGGRRVGVTPAWAASESSAATRTAMSVSWRRPRSRGKPSFMSSHASPHAGASDRPRLRGSRHGGPRGQPGVWRRGPCLTRQRRAALPR
jgi:hypothetical protein